MDHQFIKIPSVGDTDGFLLSNRIKLLLLCRRRRKFSAVKEAKKQRIKPGLYPLFFCRSRVKKEGKSA